MFDFAPRRGVEFSALLLPAGAPAELAERGRLWNAVERAERRKDAQLAGEIQLSLPHELGPDDRRALALEFFEHAFVANGLAADVSGHYPDTQGDDRNYHVHGLVTMREMEAAGLSARRSPLWRPPFGRNGRGEAYLRDPSVLLQARELWAGIVNRALERCGFAERVDHRSYAARGIDREPEPKMGSFATSLERRGKRTRAGDDRRGVRARNRERDRERSQDGAQPFEHGPTIQHPNADVRVRAREQVLTEQYGREMAGSALARDWTVDRIAEGLRLRRGRNVVEDRGDRIIAGSGTIEEVAAILETARLKNWGEIEFGRGWSDENKRYAMRAALDAGFSVKARGHDGSLLRAVREARDAEQQSADPATSARAPRDVGGVMRDDAVTKLLAAATNDHAYFTQRALERAAHKFARTPDEARELLARALASPALVEVGRTGRGATLYSTREVRGLETRMVEDVAALAAHRAFPVDMQRLEELIAEKQSAGKLSEQQATALRHIASDNGFAAVVGYAGAGKSTMLKIYRQVAEEAGYTVVGTALAAKAVRNLKEVGIPGRTLASYLRRWTESDDGRAPREPLTDKHIIIPDEAGMIGTPQFAEMARLANEAGAKIVAIGDPGQLQPVEGGGAFALLLGKHGAARLTEVWRQKLDRTDSDPQWMRKASVLFGDGHAVDALRAYDERGYVRGYETRDDARAALIESWTADRAANPARQQLILASTHADIADLNERARAFRRAAGELGAEITVDTPAGKKLPEGEKTFAVGDDVYFLQNDESIGVDNGSMGSVVAVDGTVIRVALREEKPRAVAVDLMKYPDVQLGYAVVMHKSQGTTIGESGEREGRIPGDVYLMASSFLNSELAYVGMSRHVDSATMFWSKDVFANRAQLDRVVGRSSAKSTTLDVENTLQASSGSYLRTPHQLDRDLKSVLDLARELARSASGEKVEPAARALAAIEERHAKLSFDLERLRAADVTTLAVPNHGSGYGDRVDALSRAVENAVVRLDAQPAVERGEPVRAVEPPAPMVPTELPAGAIEVQSVSPELIERANIALDSGNYLDTTAALLLLTGRRPSEIMKSGEFRTAFDDKSLLFAGQLMTRDEDRKQTSYEIPTLVSAKRCLEAIERVRASRDFASMTPAEINASTAKSLGVAVRRSVGDFKPRDLRGAYAALSFETAAIAGEDRFAYNARVLAHRVDDIDTTRSYAKWSVAGREAETVVSYEKSATELLANLRSQVVDARAARNDSQVGYLEERIEKLQTTSWFAPVRALNERLEPAAVRAELGAALSIARERLQSAEADVAALPATAPPLHPDAAIDAEKKRLRAEFSRASAYTPAALSELRRLESRSDAASIAGAAKIREENQRARAAAERDHARAVSEITSPATREKLMRAYLQSLEGHRESAETRARAEAAVRASAADVARFERMEAAYAAAEQAGTAPDVVIDGSSRAARVEQIASAVEAEMPAPEISR